MTPEYMNNIFKWASSKYFHMIIGIKGGEIEINCDLDSLLLEDESRVLDIAITGLDGSGRTVRRIFVPIENILFIELKTRKEVK